MGGLTTQGVHEPATGLHLTGRKLLLACWTGWWTAASGDRDAHHKAVMAHADWIIDLGPGAGRIVFEGTPADLVAARSTLTGQHLAAYVGS
jgi:excinuclease UvrABC ATPase subunit